MTIKAMMFLFGFALLLCGCETTSTTEPTSSTSTTQTIQTTQAPHPPTMYSGGMH